MIIYLVIFIVFFAIPYGVGAVLEQVYIVNNKEPFRGRFWLDLTLVTIVIGVIVGLIFLGAFDLIGMMFN